MFTLLTTLASIVSPADAAPRTIAQLAAFELALTLWTLRARSAARRCGTATREDWQEIADDVEALSSANDSLHRTAAKAARELRWGDADEAGIVLAHHCGMFLADWTARVDGDLDALRALDQHGAEVREGLGCFRVEYQGRIVREGCDLGDVARNAALDLRCDDDSDGPDASYGPSVAQGRVAA